MKCNYVTRVHVYAFMLCWLTSEFLLPAWSQHLEGLLRTVSSVFNVHGPSACKPCSNDTLINVNS